MARFVCPRCGASSIEFDTKVRARRCTECNVWMVEEVTASDPKTI